MYGLGYIPHNVIIGMDMVVRYSNYGFNITNIINKIEEALDEPPSKPTGFMETDIQETSIALTWDKNIEQDMEGYEILYTSLADKDKTGTSKAVVTVDKDTTDYTLTDLEPDTPYFISIRAFDNRDKFSVPNSLFLTTLQSVPELSHGMMFVLMLFLSAIIIGFRKKGVHNQP